MHFYEILLEVYIYIYIIGYKKNIQIRLIFQIRQQILIYSFYLKQQSFYFLN